MSPHLHGFLSDTIRIVDKFPDIRTLGIRPGPDKKLALAAVDALGGNQIAIRGSSLVEIPEWTAMARLDSLTYLGATLSTVSEAAQFKIDIDVGVASDNSTPAIKALSFKTPKSTISYNTTDPFMDRTTMRKPIGVWPVSFPVGPESIREFLASAKLHEIAGKGPTRNPDVFTLVYDGTAILARFGAKRNVIETLLNDTPTQNEPAFEILLGLRTLKLALSVLGPDGAIISICQDGIKLETETRHGLYTIIMGRKLE